MKYLFILSAFVFFSCSNNQTTDTDTSTEVVAPDMEATEETTEATSAIETPVEKEVIMESAINEDAEVRTAFLSMVDAVNSAAGDNAAAAMAYLDKDYAFKGKDREESVARMEKQFSRFQSEISDVEIRQLNSSCDLAYLIASFKRTMIDRESGEVRVDAKAKVGLFIMRKDESGQWKLVVQKTDDGFAHWYYMPEEK